jgi:hypothetical protein
MVIDIKNRTNIICKRGDTENIVIDSPKIIFGFSEIYLQGT